MQTNVVGYRGSRVPYVKSCGVSRLLAVSFSGSLAVAGYRTKNAVHSRLWVLHILSREEARRSGTAQAIPLSPVVAGSHTKQYLDVLWLSVLLELGEVPREENGPAASPENSTCARFMRRTYLIIPDVFGTHRLNLNRCGHEPTLSFASKRFHGPCPSSMDFVFFSRVYDWTLLLMF